MIHPIDPGLPALMAEMSRMVSVTDRADPIRLREDFRGMVASLHDGGPIPAIGSVRDSVVDIEGTSVKVRTYRPDTAQRSAGAVGGDVVVYFHGGGWMVGDLDTADANARALAHGLPATVVSVEYRCAPEYPFPAAFNDCIAVTRSVAATAAPRWLAVAGDSAGGNLAAAVANNASAALGGYVDAQLLFYPALDMSQGSQSYQRFADGYPLTAEAMHRYWKSYTGNGWAGDQRAAPAVATELSGTAPAVICTAGYDVLLDEGEHYAARLVAAGVPVSYLPTPTLTHGWLDLADRLPAAAAARDAAVAALGGLRDAAVRTDRASTSPKPQVDLRL